MNSSLGCVPLNTWRETKKRLIYYLETSYNCRFMQICNFWIQDLLAVNEDFNIPFVKGLCANRYFDFTQKCSLEPKKQHNFLGVAV